MFSPIFSTMTTCIRWGAYKKLRNPEIYPRVTELGCAGDADKCAFLKSTPWWFLRRLKFESYCYKGRGKQRSFWKILCLWHTEFLNVELMPSSVVTLLPRLQSRCRSPEDQEGHRKDTTPAKLISGRKSCKLCTKQFNKYSGAHLRGKSCGCGITGCKGILCQRKGCPDSPKPTLSSLSLPWCSLEPWLLYNLFKVGIRHNRRG